MPSSNKKLLLSLSHHKCASTWIQTIFAVVCRELRLRYSLVFTEKCFDNDLAGYVRQHRPDLLAYANADLRRFDGIPMENTRGIHLVRDPRDIIVSAYFSHRNSHPTDGWPELIPHREKLQSCSKEEGLFLEMDFRAQQFDEMRSWAGLSDSDNIMLVRMEQLTADPYAGMLEILDFLQLLDNNNFTPARRAAYLACKGLRRFEDCTRRMVPIPLAPAKVPAERILGIVWEFNFKRLSGGRAKGHEDSVHHYRKGIPGDWQNHFTEEHAAYFKEKYNDVLMQYEYESSDDWEVGDSGRSACL